MVYFIASIFTWIFFFVSSLVFFPILALIRAFTQPFDSRRLWLAHQFTSIWGSSFTWLNPLWKVKITGKNNIEKGKTYVMVSNHQSLLDILVLFRLFRQYKWVAKIELFKVPILGWTMLLNRYIAIDRTNKTSHLKMMKKCEINLANRNSIMIFPEGTRSEDGQIQSFKDGAFKLALDTHTDILPIVLSGTAESIPKSGLMFKKFQTIRVQVLPAVPYNQFSGKSVRELANEVREMMLPVYDNLSRK